jgi:hypothetical protein
MTALPASKVLRPRPFGGWALSAAVELDAHSPGFISYVLCASVAKRQTIFAALTALEHDEPDILAARLSAVAPAHYTLSPNPKARIAQALTLLRARKILQAVYGESPRGLLGMLSRLGDSPLPRQRLYRVVFELLSDPKHRE